MNEAFARADALLHSSIQGETGTPPASPSDGVTWLVASGATGEWTGQDQKLACFQAGNWIFIQPQDGLRVFDLSSQQEQLFFGTWKKTSSIQEPIGGTTVDNEARAVISDLITALRALGILPSA